MIKIKIKLKLNLKMNIFILPDSVSSVRPCMLLGCFSWAFRSLSSVLLEPGPEIGVGLGGGLGINLCFFSPTGSNLEGNFFNGALKFYNS